MLRRNTDLHINYLDTRQSFRCPKVVYTVCSKYSAMVTSAIQIRNFRKYLVDSSIYKLHSSRAAFGFSAFVYKISSKKYSFNSKLLNLHVINLYSNFVTTNFGISWLLIGCNFCETACLVRPHPQTKVSNNY